MKDKINIKNKWLHLRLSEAEYQHIENAFSKTTEKKMAKYIRSILLGEPVIAGYRNLSMDGLLKEFSKLNKTLNGIGNNYNQSVHKLHTLSHIPQIESWIASNEIQLKTLMNNIEEIKDYLKQNSAQWLQS